MNEISGDNLFWVGQYEPPLPLLPPPQTLILEDELNQSNINSFFKQPI